MQRGRCSRALWEYNPSQYRPRQDDMYNMRQGQVCRASHRPSHMSLEKERERLNAFGEIQRSRRLGLCGLPLDVVEHEVFPGMLKSPPTFLPLPLTLTLPHHRLWLLLLSEWCIKYCRCIWQRASSRVWANPANLTLLL